MLLSTSHVVFLQHGQTHSPFGSVTIGGDKQAMCWPHWQRSHNIIDAPFLFPHIVYL
jgi:hypothetical protein